MVHLNNRCLPDVLNDIVIHGSHDPEEYSFLEEIHILRRLHATYFACRNWVESKSAINIQSWKVADFFIINHGDLRRMVPFFDLLQVKQNIYLNQKQKPLFRFVTIKMSVVQTPPVLSFSAISKVHYPKM